MGNFKMQFMYGRKILAVLFILVYVHGCAQKGSEDTSSGQESQVTLSPSVSFSSDLASIAYNGSVLLNWSTTGMDSCGASGNWFGDKGTVGSEVIASLTVDSSFVLTCTGSGGDISKTLDVSVAPPVPPGVSLSANPVNVITNGSTNLTWNSTNATDCTASDDWSGNRNTSGSLLRTNLTDDKTYTLTCTGAGGTASDSVSIAVMAPSAPIVNLSASPTSVAYNGSTKLTWNGNNVDSCSASDDWSGSRNISGSTNRNNLTSNSTYTLTCTGPGGSASDSVTVSVAPPPPSVNLSASPSTVAADGMTTFSWDSSNATDCTASGDWSGSRNTSGTSNQGPLSEDRTYILTCSGAGGTASDSVNVLVTNPDESALCAPLAPPTGNIVSIGPGQTQQLPGIVAAASQGDTILLEDGNYDLNGSILWISTPGVSLRSASGNPENVILDGGYNSNEIVTVAASNVTIGEITIRRAFTHPIHVTSSNLGNTNNTLIYRVNISDPREQAIKINPHANGFYADNGTVACSEIRLTDQGRPNVNTTISGCYTGGIDAHQARGWTVRDNLFEGFWCNSGLSEHAIHFWRGGRDTTIERNRLRDNARGIGLGLVNSGSARTYSDNFCPEAGGAYVGHYGGIIRNNFIHVSAPGLLNSPDGFDCGICLASACKAAVVHNSIVSTGNNFSSVEWRFTGSTGIEVRNNIATHPLRARDGGNATLSDNLENAPLSLFVDAQNGDLHLDPGASAAIDQGGSLSPGLADSDIDDDLRDSSPDIGADEVP